MARRRSFLRDPRAHMREMLTRIRVFTFCHEISKRSYHKYAIITVLDFLSLSLCHPLLDETRNKESGLRGRTRTVKKRKGCGTRAVISTFLHR